MIIVQFALIILVAAPVLAIAVYLWLQLASYVRKSNKIDSVKERSGKRRRK